MSERATLILGVPVIFGAYILGFWWVVLLAPLNWLHDRWRREARHVYPPEGYDGVDFHG